MDFEFVERHEGPARIKVIGVGGGGGNAINTMVLSKRLDRVDFVVANSDLQDLERSEAAVTLKIGPQALHGQGCGADPEKGRLAAEESEAELISVLHGADMVFVTAGMGGGTGTGAVPVVARIARELGALTVGVVTVPFSWEGGSRSRKAKEGVAQLREAVDSLIVIPNDRLEDLVGDDTPFVDAFKMVDQVLLDAVAGISEIIDIGGFINVDFADVRAIMAQHGRALMGTGRATGQGRAGMAAQNAISSPLLDEVRIEGATGVLVNVTGSENLTLREIRAAVAPIQAAVSGDANIIFGAVIDPTMGDEVKVTVIATGIDQDDERVRTTTRRQRSRETPAASGQALADPRPAVVPMTSSTSVGSMPRVTATQTAGWERDRPAYVRRREAEQAASLQRPGPPPMPNTLPAIGGPASDPVLPGIRSQAPSEHDLERAPTRQRGDAWWNRGR